MKLRGLFVSCLFGLAILGCSASGSRSYSESDGGSGNDGGAITSEGGAAAAPKDSGKPEPSDGPVTIKNLSFSTSTNGNSLEITFALVNSSLNAIDRVRDVSVTSGKTAKFPLTCEDPQFIVGPKSTSKVITLALYESGTAAQPPYLTSGCGSSYGDVSTKPWDGDVTITVRGIMDDAEPWEAVATAANSN